MRETAQSIMNCIGINQATRFLWYLQYALYIPQEHGHLGKSWNMTPTLNSKISYGIHHNLSNQCSCGKEALGAYQDHQFSFPCQKPM